MAPENDFPTPPNRLQQQLDALRNKLKKQHNHGARLHGRFFQDVLLPSGGDWAGKMERALQKTLRKYRDRRLHGLCVEDSGRRLRHEALQEELRHIEARLEELQVDKGVAERKLKEQLRKDEDARLIHHGEVLRVWRENDPSFEKRIRQELPARLRTAYDFEAVGLPVPKSLPPSTDDSGADSKPAETVSPASPTNGKPNPASAPQKSAPAPKSAPTRTTTSAVPPKSAPRAMPSPARVPSTSGTKPNGAAPKPAVSPSASAPGAQS